MIPAAPGLVAHYKHTDERGIDDHETRPVVAFDGGGMPHVLPEKGGRLVQADSCQGYGGIAMAKYPPIISLVPADGWRVEYQNADGEVWSKPLVGWGLRADGRVVALDVSDSGVIGEVESGELLDTATCHRIYLPDEVHTEKPSESAAAGE